MALGIFTTDPDEVSKSMFDQEQRLARLRDADFRQRRKLLAARLRESGNLQLGLSTGTNIGTGEDLSRFNVGVRDVTQPIPESVRNAETMININEIPAQRRKIYDEPIGPELAPEQGPQLGVGFSDTVGIQQVDEEASQFIQDIQGLKSQADFSRLLEKIRTRAAIGYGDRLAGSPAGRFYGYFFDSATEAKERSKSAEAANWFRTKEALDYFMQNPNELEGAAIDPTGWYNNYKAKKTTEPEIIDDKTPSSTTGLVDDGTNKFVTNASKSIKAGKFDNKTTRMTIDTARRLGVDEGEALALLANESNFGNTPWKGLAGKGPLQIERIAHQDILIYYLGYGLNDDKTKFVKKSDPPPPQGVDPAEWTKLKQEAQSIIDFKKVSNNEQAAITAALLFFKLIKFKGVAPQFQGAAYNDGYGKFLGINKLSDVKKFAGNHTLKSVTEYNNAFNILKTSLPQVAGLNTATVASGTTEFKINQGGQEVTGNYGSLTGNLAKEVAGGGQESGVDTGGAAGPTNDDRTNFYLSNPTRLGRDLNNAINARTLAKEQAERDINLLYSDLLAAELSGKMGLYSDLLTRIRAIQTNAENALYAQDITIQQLNGMQALSDLFVGSPQRASFILSEAKGIPHLVVPRNDGKFDIEVDGKLFKTMNFRDISDYIRSSFDEQYRVTKATSAAELAKMTLEQQNELQKIFAEGRVNKENLIVEMRRDIKLFGREFVKVTENWNETNIPAMVSKDGKTAIIPYFDEEENFVEYRLAVVGASGINRYKD